MELAAEIDFKSLFESAPGLYLILKPDLTIIAVSDAYLHATMTKRNEITGKGLFEVFPDNPEDPDASGVSNLRASLNYVLENKTAHTMAVQKYDIRRPDGSFEERYWSPLNKPVFDKNNLLTCIIHRAEDVTEFIKLKKEEDLRKKLTEDLRGQMQQMEIETYKRAQEIQDINSKLLNEIHEKERSQEELKANQLMFSTIFYQSPVMNTIADASDGRYIEVNENFARFCGKNKEEIIGKTSLEIKEMPQFKNRNELMAEIRKFGFARDVTMEATDRNGETRWISLSAHAVNINGRNCFLTVMIDVTERKKAEEKVRASESLIRTQKQDIQDFIDSMSTLCAKVATDGTLLMVNKTALHATGLTIEQLLNTNFLEGQWWTYNSDVHTRVKNAFAKACEGVVINYDENIFVFGQVIPINFSLIPILDIHGEVDYLVAEGRDISSLKQTEAQLQKKAFELEEANKELESFSYSVSHDLRAPLRIIHGYTEIIIEDYSGKIEEEGKRMLDIVNNNVRRMGQLIDDLLNLSRTGRKELVFNKVNVHGLVESAVSDLKISGDKLPEMHTEKLEPVYTDANLLQQVWINLISNAVKYSRTKQDPSIEIRSERKKDEIVYSVKDNGVGFDMKYAGKLFGVFQRLHKMNEFEGTGVGLALVHRIVTKLGGRVWAEAEVGKGATFFFSLPDKQTKPLIEHANPITNDTIVQHN
jgi:PAS domain S-box-containing protein